MEWVGLSFGTRILTSLFSAGTVLAAVGMQGGNVLATVFLLFGTAAGLNTLFSATYLIRKGTVRGAERDRRRRVQVARSKSKGTISLDKERSAKAGKARGRRRLRPRRPSLAWLQRRVEPRLKYPWIFYVPWGGGQHGRYFVMVVIGFASGLVSWFGEFQLIKDGMPVSIAVFLGWASHCWLAIWEVRKLFPNFRWRTRHRPFADPCWGSLKLAGIGVFELAGVAVAAGILSTAGIDVLLFGNPIVLMLLADSLVLAWLSTFFKETRIREEKYFLARMGHLTPEDHIFLSTKQGFWASAMRCVWCCAGFVACGLYGGFPHVEHWGPFVGFIALYIAGSLGNRVGTVAAAEGEPALNGIGSTGAIGFSFLWTWIFQGIGAEPFQLVGGAMTIAGAVAWAFTEEETRTKLKALLRKARLRRRSGT